MMFRPRPTTWFELLVGREQLALAMQTLAETGAAQLEAKPEKGSEPVLPRLDGFFAAFAALEAEYAPYWPERRGHAGLMLSNPIAALEETQARLQEWANQADPMVAALRGCEARYGELRLIAKLIAALPGDTPIDRLTEAQSKLLEHAIFFVPDTEAELPAIDNVLFDVFPAEGGSFVIVIADQPEMAEIVATMASLRAAPVPLPDFLGSVPAEHATQVRAQMKRTQAECEDKRARIDALSDQTGLVELLDRVAVLKWLQENSGDISASPHMMHISGWTSSPDGAALHAALTAARVDYALMLGDPSRTNPPMVLSNPGWLRAFEFFPRLLGVPADSDVDPSALTALIAPLLFGFMFGDVGQGAVLMVAGLVLSRRIPMLLLLVPGGAVAILFGLLFGSVFSIETLLPALWLHPLHAPMTVLATALVLGAVLLLLGIALDFTQALWHRRGLDWLRETGGLTLAFLGLLGAWFLPETAWAVPVGFALTLAGARDDGRWSAAAMGRAGAEFAEAIIRLLVSTVSFSRVGAFALAHAGLSAAIVGVAESIGGIGFWIALLIGNILIIALEGLVTSIQTTRLILFEFYFRFFRAEGREFRPLVAPSRPHINEGTSP